MPPSHLSSIIDEAVIRDQTLQQNNKSNFYPPHSAFHSYSLKNNYNNNDNLKRSNSTITQNLKSTNSLSTRVETPNLKPSILDVKNVSLNNSKKIELPDSLNSDILQMKQNYVTLNINSIPSSPSCSEKLTNFFFCFIKFK